MFPPAVYGGREGQVLIADPRLERFEAHALSRAVKVVAQSFHDGHARINLEELVVDEQCAVVFSGGGQGSVLTQMEGSHPSLLRGQVIAEDGERLVFVNPHGFYIKDSPFQNVSQLTLIAALLEQGGNGSRFEEMRRGAGGLMIEDLRLLNEAYKGVRWPPSPPPKDALLEAPSSDLSRLMIAGAFVHIRGSSLELKESVHLRFLRGALRGERRDVFSLDEASEIRTEFLSLESLEEGERIVSLGKLYLGKRGLKVRAQGDVFFDYVETSGPIDIETPGKVEIQTLRLKGGEARSLKIRGRDICFEYGSKHGVGDSFVWPKGSLELYARENLITALNMDILHASVHVECGGNWIHGGVVSKKMTLSHLAARVLGVWRQQGAIHAREGYTIFAHRYEKRSPLLGTEKSQVVVQDLAVLDGVERGFLKSLGRMVLRGRDRVLIKEEDEEDPLLAEDDPRTIGYEKARIDFMQATIKRAFERRGGKRAELTVSSEREMYPDLYRGKAFVNGGTLIAQEMIQMAHYIRNGGEVHTFRFRVFKDLVKEPGGGGRGIFVNPGVFEAREGVWEDSRLFLSTGVFKMGHAVFKGGRLIVREEAKKTLSYRNGEGKYVTEPSGFFEIGRMETTPFYEFERGYNPNYESSTFLEDALQVDRLKAYWPVKMKLKSARVSINQWVIQDAGGEVWRGWDKRALSREADAPVHFAPLGKSPLKSRLEIRGGSLEVGDLSLQLERLIMEPEGDELPLMRIKGRSQINIWEAFHLNGTFQYLGRDAFHFNFFPKVLGYVSLEGYLDHWGRIYAPHAAFSLLGLGKGGGRIKAKEFYYRPYLEKGDRLHGAEMKDPLEGVLYQHLLERKENLPQVLEERRVKVEEEKVIKQTRLLREREIQEQALRGKEISATYACAQNIQGLQSAINAAWGERERVTTSHDKKRGQWVISRRSEGEKAAYDQQIAAYQAQQAKLAQESALWMSQTVAAIQALAVNTSQAILEMERALNAEVEGTARALNQELEEGVRAMADALGSSADFGFVVEADMCAFGVCAPRVGGAIFAKTRVDLKDVVALRTGGSFRDQGMTFVEALRGMREEKHPLTRALVPAPSRAPLVEEMAAFLDAAGIRPGDVFGQSIQIGGARAEIGARLGLRGVTEEMVLTPQILAVMAGGSIGAARAEVFSRDLVTAGEINVGTLRSFIQTIIDLGGRTNIEKLEWGEIAHILRISGSMTVTQPLILAARQLIRFLSGSETHVGEALHVEAPHVETAGNITVHSQEGKEGRDEEARASGLRIRAQSTYTQTGGLLRAPLISLENTPVTVLAGGEIAAEDSLVVESGAVFQLPGHTLTAERIGLISQERLGVHGEVNARSKLQLSVPLLDLRELEKFRTPEVDVFMEGNLEVLMPTHVHQALYLHTQGGMNITEPLTLEKETVLVGEKSAVNTSKIRGEKKLSIILRGPNSVFHNKGTVHSGEHLVMDAPRILNEKRVIWLSDGRFAEFEGGDLTSDNLLEVHGRAYDGQLGRIEGHHVWVDVDDFYASGVTRARGTMVYDARRSRIERLQHTWEEVVTHTTKKKGMFGSKKSSHTTRERRIQSYPEHLSGVLEAGTLIGDSRIDVSEIFTDRHTHGNPLIERMSIRGGRIKAGAGGIHLWVKDHFETAPHVEVKLTPYSSSARTWGGKHHQSGHIAQEVAHPATIISQGPIVLESENTLSFQGAHVESMGVGRGGRIHIRARNGITFPHAKVRVEHAPRVIRKGMMLYDVRGFHEESVTSHFISPYGVVDIESREGDITGAEPEVRSFSSSSSFTARNISFTPLILESQETQVPIGSVVDGGVVTLASLAAAVLTHGAGGAVAKGLFDVGTLGHSMVAGGISSLIGQGAVGLVTHGGNPIAALQDIASERGLRSVAMGALSAGLTHELQPALRVPVHPKTFGDFMHVNAVRSVIGTGLDMSIGGVEASVALEAGARGFVAGTLQGYGAHHVGESYAHHELDPLTHKLLHGAMGAGAGVILDGDDSTRGALSGAMTFFAEMGADWMNRSTPKRAIRTEADLSAYMDELQYEADVGRLIGAAAAYAFGQDVGIAAVTGGTAVEFNHVDSHAAAAIAELAAYQSQQQSAQHGRGVDDAEAADEEIARITGLDETLGMFRDLKEQLEDSSGSFFTRPPSPPIADLSEAEIVKSVRAGVGKGTHGHLRDEWGAYDAPLTGMPTISSETKASVRELYELAKRLDPQFARVAKTVEDLPANIERGIQLWREERERSAEGFTRFVEERSWEAFSVRDTLGTVAFGMLDAMGEDVKRVGQGLSYVETGIEYGKAYMRRGLRYMGVSPVVAQAVVNGAEGGALLWAGTGAVRAGVGRIPGEVRDVAASILGQQGGRQALRHEASGLSAVERTLTMREAGVPEVGSAARGQQMLIWDARGSAVGQAGSTEKIHGCSLSYVGDTHVYVMRDSDGMLYKVGESMQGVNKLGQSKRAEAQARKLRLETGEEYRTEIRRTFSTKTEARTYETKLIERYRRMFGDKLLPGNKGTR